MPLPLSSLTSFSCSKMQAQFQSRSQFRFSHHVHSHFTINCQYHPSVTLDRCRRNRVVQSTASARFSSSHLHVQAMPSLKVVQSSSHFVSSSPHVIRATGRHTATRQPWSSRPSHRRFDRSFSSVGIHHMSLSSNLSRVFIMFIASVTSCQLEAAAR
jgi:hypothetical protein